MSDDVGAQRAHGCLLGGAVGDALGEPVAILPIGEIHRVFGSGGISNYAYDGRGKVSSITQMGMFVAEGLIRSRQQMHQNPATYDVRTAVHHALLRWLITQDEDTTRHDVPVRTDGWLFAVSGMHQRRMPCLACMRALKAAQALGKPALADNEARGSCGMHFAVPVGLTARCLEDDDTVFGVAADIAALTHASPTAFLVAGHFAVTVAAVLRGETLGCALECASRALRQRSGSQAVADAVATGVALAHRDCVSADDIEALGSGWRDAREVLAIALCCALRASNFSEGILLAVNHSGASHYTAAATGTLLGAALGASAIPPSWLANLRLRGEITRLADDLHGTARGLLDVRTLASQYPPS